MAQRASPEPAIHPFVVDVGQMTMVEGNKTLSVKGQIAADAGVSKVTVYNHFDTKEAIAMALALWLAETMAAERLIVHGSVTLPAGSRVQVETA